MKLRLTVISGSHTGAEFSIEPQQCATFGRTGASQWSFEDDGHMSSVHFEVENLGDTAQVRDRGSTNGTWLNNQRVNQEALREGDRLRAGTTVLTVEFVRDMVPATPAEDTPPAFPIPEPREVERPAALETPPPPPPLSAAPPATPKRRSTPFDSMVFVDEDAEEDLRPPQPRLDLPGGTAGGGSSPITDSSMFIVNEDVADKEPKTAENFQLFIRHTSQDAADSLGTVLETFAKKWSVQMVLHFQKIRITPPETLQPRQSLFPWLPAGESQAWSPIRTAWSVFSDHDDSVALLPRLCRADGCLALLGTSAAEMEPRIDQMVSMGVDGFSEPEGFLPCYWPSSFLTMVDAVGVEFLCRTLFSSNVSGAIMCSSSQRQTLVAVAEPRLALDLEEAEFAAASRIPGS